MLGTLGDGDVSEQAVSKLENKGFIESIVFRVLCCLLGAEFGTGTP